ncbi:MAG: hypothetical protein AB1757_14620 [Acidobacteriota bacterium]
MNNQPKLFTIGLTVWVITISSICTQSLATAQSEHPPLGKYAVYLFDPYGNAEYAFDFELLTPSEKGKPGRYELQMGKTSKEEKAKWSGDYVYDGNNRRLRWLSGPFHRSEIYRQDAMNPEGGKVTVKNGRWTIFLNNKARGTSVKK